MQTIYGWVTSQKLSANNFILEKNTWKFDENIYNKI